MSKRGKLKIGISQFPVSSDIKKNSSWIRRHIKRAADQRADIVHFPETALSGYGGADIKTFKNYEWDLLKEETKTICDLAYNRKIHVILGTTHRGSMGKPYNSLYLINSKGGIISRYDKHYRTPRDCKFYQAGKRYVTHTINGIKFGLLICFDFRFPEIYRQYLLKGCSLIFHSFYQTGKRPNRLMMKVAPAHLSSRAAENFMYISASIVSHNYPWWSSRLMNPDGSIFKKLKIGVPGLLVTQVDISKNQKFYNPIGKHAVNSARGRHYI